MGDGPARTIFFLPSLSRCAWRSVSVKELGWVLRMTCACVLVSMPSIEALKPA